MSIQFQSFPFIVQNLILKSMEYTEILWLSFLSSRMYRIIRSNNWNVNKMRYFFAENYMDIGFMRTIKDRCFVFSMERVQMLIQENVKKLKVGGVEVQYTMVKQEATQNLPTSVRFRMRIDERSWFTSQMAIYQHIHSLIRKSPEIQFQIHFSVNPNWIPPIPNVKDVLFAKSDLSSKQVENVLGKTEILNNVIIKPAITGPFSNNSKLFESKVVLLQESSDHAFPILFCFKGTHLVLERAVCRNSVLNEFLKRWISNQRFQNLKYLVIDFKDPNITNYRLRNPLAEIETKPWDPSRRPEGYQKDIEIMDCTPKSISMKHARDIERVSDGKLASVLVSRYRFFFCVWDL